MLRHHECKCDLKVDSKVDRILVHGARENNLKNICFAVPKNKLVVLSGASGSGKSTIASNILQAECLRQFLESAGMTTDHISKPKVDFISGLSPSIAVHQRVTDFNPLSTVGTKTGIFTFLRLLFATIGHQPCPECGAEIVQPYNEKKVEIVEVDDKEKPPSKKKSDSIKKNFLCPECECKVEKLNAAHFSFNKSEGMCPTCKGLGEVVDVDLSALISEEKTLKGGAVDLWQRADLITWHTQQIAAASKHYGFSFDEKLPIKKYTAEQRNFLLYGVNHPDFVKKYKHVKKPKKQKDGLFEGIFNYVIDRYKSHQGKELKDIEKYITHKTCPECHNMRLGRNGRVVTVADKTIIQCINLDLTELLQWVNDLPKRASKEELLVIGALSDALRERTENLIEVGLGYLSLSRTCPSLSAGETHRLRLAALLSSGLSGVLYILDEPTSGLHPKDSERLFNSLKQLRNLGNTVLIIEHDMDIIRQADYIIDMGPGGGSKGGEIVAIGTPQEIMSCERSITGQIMCGAEAIVPEPSKRKKNKLLTITGAASHNLRNIDVSIPLGMFVVLTGVSGSGKSTLLFDILDKAGRQHFYHATTIPGKHKKITGWGNVDKLITIDQLPIGKPKSSRSNVATYSSVFDLIRALFASQSAAKEKDLTAEDFSFNTSEEKCENCSGEGVVSTDMVFLRDVQLVCPVCDGMRFNENVLEVKFKGNSIADILDMTVTEALAVFAGQKKIHDHLNFLVEVGLEYLKLGQSTSTLSGGEAQRIKLAKELSKSSKGNTLYLLDEPTRGLHSREVGKLVEILQKLVANGHSVVVIEHNLEVICRADEIIDFGPGGGKLGGTVVATGTPVQIAAVAQSSTGQSLKKYLEEQKALAETRKKTLAKSSKTSKEPEAPKPDAKSEPPPPAPPQSEAAKPLEKSKEAKEDSAKPPSSGTKSESEMDTSEGSRNHKRRRNASAFFPPPKDDDPLKRQKSTCPTSGGGDCPFHAALGKLNDFGKYVCENVSAQRKKVADAVRDSKAGSPIHDLAVVAIQAIVMGDTPIEGKQIQTIKQQYHRYLEDNKTMVAAAWKKFEVLINGNQDIMEYINNETKNDPRSLRERFYDCLNKNDGLLYGLILSFQQLQAGFDAYNAEVNGSFNWKIVGDGQCLQEYASFIETPGQWLLPCELEIIAHVNNLSIDFYTRNLNLDENIFVASYNQGKKNKVEICFNATDHYERVVDADDESLALIDLVKKSK